MTKKLSYPRKRTHPPIKKGAGLTNDEDEAQRDRATERGLQRKMKNGPQKGVGISEIVWAHHNLKDDDVIRLIGSLP